MLTCPGCGQENPDSFRFCGGCGRSLEPDVRTARDERKVVTALFCDLVGSTAHAERMDPEDVRALLSHYHARVRAQSHCRARARAVEFYRSVGATRYIREGETVLGRTAALSG